MLLVALDRLEHPLQIDVIVLRPREIHEGPTSRRVRPTREFATRLTLRELLSELDQLEQVLLVANSLFTLLLNQGIEQRRHRLVVLRIHRLLIHNRLADVVDDGLGRRFRALTDVHRQLFQSAYAMLDDQLH